MSQSVSPQSIEDLQQVLQAASNSGRPTYVYRKGTPNGLTIDLTKLDKISEIDTANLVATVGPGVKLGDLAEKLVEQGLRFIPADTPFYHNKTVGQLFYEGCTNISSLKYGYTKHFLMGSEIVLPTGQLLKTGGKTVKNVTGYDFTRFFNAPYTDLGITAKFLLKLLPLPEMRKNIAAEFAELEEALTFIKEMRANRIVPAYLLWVDPVVQGIFGTYSRKQLVIMEFDGLSEEVAQHCQRTNALITEQGGTICDANGGYAPSGWSILYNSAANYVLTDEFKMAFTSQLEFIREFHLAAQQVKLNAGLFGQLAEGKLNIVLDRTMPEDGFIDKVTLIVSQLGGISSGKYARLTNKPRSGVLAELEDRAKAAFDPKRILNCESKGGE